MCESRSGSLSICMKDHYTYNVYSKYHQDIRHIGKVMDFSFKGVIFEGDSIIMARSV